jgi:hypothetical protein
MEFERNEKRPQQRAAKVIFSLSLSTTISLVVVETRRVWQNR